MLQEILSTAIFWFDLYRFRWRSKSTSVGKSEFLEKKFWTISWTFPEQPMCSRDFWKFNVPYRVTDRIRATSATLALFRHTALTLGKFKIFLQRFVFSRICLFSDLRENTNEVKFLFSRFLYGADFRTRTPEVTRGWARQRNKFHENAAPLNGRKKPPRGPKWPNCNNRAARMKTTSPLIFSPPPQLSKVRPRKLIQSDHPPIGTCRSRKFIKKYVPYYWKSERMGISYNL